MMGDNTLGYAYNILKRDLTSSATINYSQDHKFTNFLDCAEFFWNKFMMLQF